MNLITFFQSVFFAVCLCSCDSKEPPHLVTTAIRIGKPTDHEFLTSHRIAILVDANPNLKISRLIGKDLITIAAQDSDQEKARNTIQSALDSYPVNLRQATLERISALEEEIITQENLMSITLKSSILLNNTPYFHPKEDVTVNITQIKVSARRCLDDLEILRDDLEAKLTRWHDFRGLELMKYASSLQDPENNVSHYLSQHQNLSKDRSSKLSAGLPKNHPEIIALGKEAQRALQDAKHETQAFKEVLTTKLELTNRRVEQLRDLILELMNTRHGIPSREETLFFQAYEKYRKALKTREKLQTQKDLLKHSLSYKGPLVTTQN